MVRGISYGKLVEVRYLDVIRTEHESPDLDAFLAILRQVQSETDPADFSQCRVGHVDENGVGLYYDPLEFLAREGNMDNYSEPRPVTEAAP